MATKKKTLASSTPREDADTQPNIVNPLMNTRFLLTNEQKDPKGCVCDLDGNHLNGMEMHRARTCYVDGFTGKTFVLISPKEKEDLEAEGGMANVYQSVGDIHGWFVKAPDYTIKGHHPTYE